MAQILRLRNVHSLQSRTMTYQTSYNIIST